MKCEEWKQTNLRKTDQEKGSRNENWEQRPELRVKEGSGLKADRPRDRALKMLRGEGLSSQGKMGRVAKGQ